MLTKEEKKLLENKIYGIIKNYLNEWKNKEEKDDDGEISKDEENTILNWIDNSTVNKAAIAYDLYDAESESEEASARSLFYKKLDNKKNDNGIPYEFSETELNKISSIMDDARN